MVVGIRVTGIHNTLAVRNVVTGDFVVTDDADIAISACEGCHAIVLHGRDVAIGHDGAFTAKDGVLEAFGKHQDGLAGVQRCGWGEVSIAESIVTGCVGEKSTGDDTSEGGRASELDCIE